jgi:hypothetical protein
MQTAVRIDELSGKAKALAAASDASLEHVTRADLASCRVDGVAVVGRRGGLRDDEKSTATRKAGDDVLRHALCKAVLIQPVAHVAERQYGDGGLARRGRGGVGFLVRRGRDAAILPRDEADEPVATTGQRVDAMPVIPLGEHPSERRDLNGEIALLDRATVPDSFDERALGDQCPRAVDQDGKHGDRASADRDGLGALEQDLVLSVETERAEFVNS